MTFRSRLISLLLVLTFVFSNSVLFSGQAFAAVSPGQEQSSFETGLDTRRAEEDLSSEEVQAQVGFADSEEDIEAEDEDRAAADDDADYAPASGSRRGLVLPIQGKISVKQLRQLVDAVRDADDDEEVGITIQIGVGAGSGKRSVSHVSDDFERPLPPAGYDAKESRDLKAAERAAERKARAEEEEGAVQLREEVPFFVEKIEIVGNSGIKTEELHALVAEYEGKELKLSDAKAAADKITQAYRAKGFMTCRAYIPPQKIETKVLKIKVFEGKLGKIKVRGNKYFGKRILKRYVEHLKKGPLEFNDLKSALTRINMHPDREVKAIIVPGKEVGTSDLLLDAKDSMPMHVGAEVNNFGTESTGQERYNLTARHTNLLGQDDIFATRVQFGEEVFAIGTQHVLPVGPYGTEAGWTFNYTDVNVGGDFSILDIAGEAYTASLFVNHPLRDGDRLDITWTGSLETKSIYNTVLGIDSSEDQLRLIHTGLNFDLLDPYGRTFLVNDLAFGTPWLDASEKNDPRLSRAGAGATFVKYSGALNRIHPVYDQTYLFLKGSSQFTPDKLVSAEQYDIGGVHSVRGYPQSDYLGDYGVGGSAELRVPLYFLPREIKAPYSDVPLWNRVHLVGFVDAAYAGLRSPTVGEDGSKSYIGAGGGLRIDLPKNFLARFEWASAIGDDPTDRSNGQFYFTISSDFV